MTELDKLESYLKDNGFNYDRRDDTTGLFERHQINVYDDEGKILWDAICHLGSYGYERGLLEIMGNIVQTDTDVVEGWLTADQIIERLKADSSVPKS